MVGGGTRWSLNVPFEPNGSIKCPTKGVKGERPLIHKQKQSWKFKITCAHTRIYWKTIWQCNGFVKWYNRMRLTLFPGCFFVCQLSVRNAFHTDPASESSDSCVSAFRAAPWNASWPCLSFRKHVVLWDPDPNPETTSHPVHQLGLEGAAYMSILLLAASSWQCSVARAAAGALQPAREDPHAVPTPAGDPTLR